MSFYWQPYVPVAQRRAKAQRQLKKRLKKGASAQPVSIAGRTIAQSFWGKAWCDHLESFHDYANRLPRGRTYVRNGSVCHLTIAPGRIAAFVSGSSLYEIDIRIAPLKPAPWKRLVAQCSGQIGSMLDLLRGKISKGVMTVVADRAHGLLPQPGEIKMSCSCPDRASMCKHLAAVLYGVGSRLDQQPELLFELRGVDPQQLISAELKLPAASQSQPAIAEDQLGAIFGIELDTDPPAPPEPRPSRKKVVKKPPEQAAQKAGKTLAKKSKAPRKTSDKPGRAAKKTTAKKSAVAISPISANAEITATMVAQLRTRLGLGQAQFAQKLGVSTSSVINWEQAPGTLRLHQKSRHALLALAAQTAS